jgi:hypothetical protein
MNTFMTGADNGPVTVVSCSTDKLDVFIVGLDGRAYTAAWEKGDPDWRGWWRIDGAEALPARQSTRCRVRLTNWTSSPSAWMVMSIRPPGNLANRMLSFAYKRFEGQVPEPGNPSSPSGRGLDDEDRALPEKVEAGFDTVGELYNACRSGLLLRFPQYRPGRGPGSGPRGQR